MNMDNRKYGQIEQNLNKTPKTSYKWIEQNLNKTPRTSYKWGVNGLDHKFLNLI